MKYICLVDNNARRRRSLNVVLTSGGGFHVAVFAAYSHIPPDAQVDLILIAEHMLDSVRDFLPVRTVSFGQSITPLGNISHITLRQFPAFAQQVRELFEEKTN